MKSSQNENTDTSTNSPQSSESEFEKGKNEKDTEDSEGENENEITIIENKNEVTLTENEIMVNEKKREDKDTQACEKDDELSEQMSVLLKKIKEHIDFRIGEGWEIKKETVVNAIVETVEKKIEASEKKILSKMEKITDKIEKEVRTANRIRNGSEKEKKEEANTTKRKEAPKPLTREEWEREKAKREKRKTNLRIIGLDGSTVEEKIFVFEETAKKWMGYRTTIYTRGNAEWK